MNASLHFRCVAALLVAVGLTACPAIAQEREGRRSPEAEAGNRRSPEAEAGPRRSAEAEAGPRRSAEAEAEAGPRRSPEGERAARDGQQGSREGTQDRPREGGREEGLRDSPVQDPLRGFRPQSRREAALLEMILQLRREVAELRRAVESQRGDGRGSAERRDGDRRDGDRRDGNQRDGEQRDGQRDGDNRDRGYGSPERRDGDRPAVQRDGDRRGEGARESGRRDGDREQRREGERDGESSARSGDREFRLPDQWENTKEGQVFRAYDANGDEIVTLNEWLAMTNGTISESRRALQTKRFNAAEPSGDGKFTPAEFYWWYGVGRHEKR